MSRSVAESRSLLVRRLHAATLRQSVNDSRLGQGCRPPPAPAPGWQLTRRSTSTGRMPRMGKIELAAAAKSSSGSYTFLLVIVVLFGLFYFVMIRPQRNRQRQAQQMQQQVMPGQQVRTAAGMYATVVSADDSDVVLESAPGVQVRFLRRGVLEVVPDD